MNMPPPPPLHLRWSPVEPSWLVSFGLIVLAVLPHQIPQTGQRALRHPIGAVLFAGLSAWVAWKAPVLGAAMFIFLTGVLLHTQEGFAAATLNKDRVQGPTRKWMGEEIMSEDPHGIQERTENPILNYDEVTDNQKAQWHAEQVLDEQPRAIQEKPVSTVLEYDEGGASYGHHR